jgi:hypothetical protein
VHLHVDPRFPPFPHHTSLPGHGNAMCGQSPFLPLGMEKIGDEAEEGFKPEELEVAAEAFAARGAVAELIELNR